MQYIQVLLGINIQQLYLSDSLITLNPVLVYWKCVPRTIKFHLINGVWFAPYTLTSPTFNNDTLKKRLQSCRRFLAGFIFQAQSNSSAQDPHAMPVNPAIPMSQVA